MSVCHRAGADFRLQQRHFIAEPEMGTRSEERSRRVPVTYYTASASSATTHRSTATPTTTINASPIPTTAHRFHRRCTRFTCTPVQLSPQQLCILICNALTKLRCGLHTVAAQKHAILIYQPGRNSEALINLTADSTGRGHGPSMVKIAQTKLLREFAYVLRMYPSTPMPLSSRGLACECGDGQIIAVLSGQWLAPHSISARQRGKNAGDFRRA